MSRGVFAVSRAIWEHPVLDTGDPFSRREAFAWLVSEAAWEPRTVRRIGKDVALARGELCHSLEHMADRWRWTKAKVRHFLKVLTKERMIDVRADNGRASNTGNSTAESTGRVTGSSTGISVLTVRNYGKYQFGNNTACSTGSNTGQQHEQPHQYKEEKTVPYGTGGPAAANILQFGPLSADPKKALFDAAVPWLKAQGRTPVAARSLIGKWMKLAADDATLVLELVQRGIDEQVADAPAWVAGAIKSRDDRGEKAKHQRYWGRG